MSAPINPEYVVGDGQPYHQINRSIPPASRGGSPPLSHPHMLVPPGMLNLPNFGAYPQLALAPKKRVRRLPAEKRQKVLLACDLCKKAKHKCDGVLPCGRCTKKQLECVYLMVDKRTLKGERMERKAMMAQLAAQAFKNLPVVSNGGDGDVPEPFHRRRTLVSVAQLERKPVSTTVTPSHTTTQSLPATVSSSTPEEDLPFLMVSAGLTPALAEGAGRESLPKLLQPLLSFDEDEAAKPIEPRDDLHVLNQQGKCAIWLADSEGTYRYISETCPLSLLYDSRNLFRHYFGKSGFTDTLKACPVLDKPYFNIEYKVAMPSRDTFSEYANYFETSINDVYYIFDPGHLETALAELVYANPYHATYDRICYFLVAGLGSLFKDFEQGQNELQRLADLFRTGIKLWHEHQDFDDFWLIRLNFLAHFYYLALCKKLTLWVYLKTAISHAEALGMHRVFIIENHFSPVEVVQRKRLFRSLYTADRVLGSILGRPFAINDRDWDELPAIMAGKVQSQLVLEQLQLELVKITAIISKIVDNYYLGSSIDLYRTKRLSLELKNWAINVDKQFDMSNLIKLPQLPSNGHVILMMHMLQLYLVMLLARPFFIHELISEFTGQPGNRLAQQFQESATKAAVLTVNLIHYFNQVAVDAGKFNETNVPTNVVFFAGLMIGTQLLSKNLTTAHSQELSDALKVSMQVLNRYGKTFKTASRYVEIMPYMAEHISMSKQQQPHPSAADEVEVGKGLNWEFLDDLDFITDLNGDLLVLAEFQQGFVPSEFATINTLYEEVTRPTELPYNYPNYELFYGDKY